MQATKTKKIFYRSVGSTQHMCINIAGALRNNAKTKSINYFDDEHGNPMNPKKAYQLLQLYQYEGKRVIPMNSGCYRFDYQTGCPGHINSLMPIEEKMIEIEKEWQQYLHDNKMNQQNNQKNIANTMTNSFLIDEPVIRDSHFGYDVGYFKGEGALYETYAIQLKTGVVQDKCCYPKTEIHKYTPEKIAELTQKYGYKKEL